jgi:hypothetical protein
MTAKTQHHAMKGTTTPTINPIALKDYEVKQSKYNIVGKLPIRSILLAPSSSGKTVLIQNMIFDIYKDLFERVSPLST